MSVDDPAQRIPEIAAITDSNGCCRWPLVPGHYLTSARAEWLSNPEQARQITADQLDAQFLIATRPLNARYN